jgi:L-asparagine oxygenase
MAGSMCDGNVHGLREEIEEKGFVVLSNTLQNDLIGLATMLGELRTDPRSPEPIRDIRPQSISVAKPNTLSTRYGTGKFPFHTDTAHWEMPARYLMLYCVSAGQGQRPTHLQDTEAWQYPLKMSALSEVWKSGHVRPTLCTVGTIINGKFEVRFDEACMSPMTGSAEKLKKNVAEQINRSDVIDINWVDGMLLILNNRRSAPARGSPRRPDPDRLIRRILIGD